MQDPSRQWPEVRPRWTRMCVGARARACVWVCALRVCVRVCVRARVRVGDRAMRIRVWAGEKVSVVCTQNKKIWK